MRTRAGKVKERKRTPSAADMVIDKTPSKITDSESATATPEKRSTPLRSTGKGNTRKRNNRNPDEVVIVKKFAKLLAKARKNQITA